MPNLFLLSSPFLTVQYMSGISPIKVSMINNHQPERPASWSLRTRTVVAGTNTARPNNALKTKGSEPPAAASMKLSAREVMKVNKAKYQYSDLDALPDNTK